MKKILKSPCFYLVMLLPLGLSLCAAAKYCPGFADFYCEKVYKPVAGFLGSITGAIPFSLMELAIGSAVVFVLWQCVSAAIRAHRGEQSVLKAFSVVLVRIFSAASAVLFLFCIFCGTNYYRTSFAKTVGLSVEKSSKEELFALCSDLLDRANALSTELEHDEHGVTRYGESDFAMARSAAEEYRLLYEKYPFLKMGGKTLGTPKPVICSFVMSKTLISGVYSPYTLEANVCREGPDFLRGFTMMHEQTHIRGFMNEAEANFVAFLACENSSDPYFEYSGYCHALLSSMNALYSADYEGWLELRQKYSSALDADMRAQNAYVSENESKISEVSDSINDAYLKINSQTDGVRSYGMVVDLLLAYWRTK